jgi:hypothetical protein
LEEFCGRWVRDCIRLRSDIVCASGCNLLGLWVGYWYCPLVLVSLGNYLYTFLLEEDYPPEKRLDCGIVTSFLVTIWKGWGCSGPLCILSIVWRLMQWCVLAATFADLERVECPACSSTKVNAFADCPTGQGEYWWSLLDVFFNFILGLGLIRRFERAFNDECLCSFVPLMKSSKSRVRPQGFSFQKCFS